MSWILLIVGVALWSGAHVFKRLAPGARARLGDPGKGLVALLLVGSIALMVIGYRGTEDVFLWSRSTFLVHVNNLLVLIAIYMMSPAPKRGALLRGMRHPMLVGFKLWAVAHVLVNGDLASVILFGGLLAWAVVNMILINKSEPEWNGRSGEGSLAMDGMFLLGSVILMGVIGYIHSWLGVWPFPG